METTYLIAFAVYFIISVLVLVKFFNMASDMRSIKELLQKAVEAKKQPANNTHVATPTKDLTDQVEMLKTKMKTDECILQVKATGKLEIWGKQDWLEVVEKDRAHMFVLFYKNF
jgi:hypothetical protein